MRKLLLAFAFLLPLVSALAVSAGGTRTALAHPLGNFTVNRYSRLEVYSDVLRVRYVLDMAEIPAFQEIADIDRDGDGRRSDGELAGYASRKSDELLDNLSLTVNGQSSPLELLASDLSFPEGQGGLDTLRLSLLLEAPVPPGILALQYRDSNYSDRIGWKEVVLAPVEGLSIKQSSISSRDLSRELTLYPDDLLSSPLDITSGSATIDASGAAAAPAIASISASSPDAAPTRAGGGFAGLIDVQQLTLPVLVLALLAAFAFGAIHALEPGHGKTLVAAYFVGANGTVRQAMLLGLIVAVTHTAGVFVIGFVILVGSQVILPETLYPWLSLASALMVLVLGLRLLAGRLRPLSRLRGVVAGHVPGHHTHGHTHAHSPDHPVGSSWKGLIALGFADGLTPSSSALVVLLAAVSLDRIGLGVALILAFSVGLAAVLAGVSLALVYVSKILAWVRSRMPARPGVRGVIGMAPSVAERVAPLAGAGVLTVVGFVLTIRALSQPDLPIF